MSAEQGPWPLKSNQFITDFKFMFVPIMENFCSGIPEILWSQEWDQLMELQHEKSMPPAKADAGIQGLK